MINGTSLDDFLDHTDNAELRQHLQHCSIDTEGWDPLVLEGFHKTLAARRVPTVAFEYIARGYWRHPMMRLSPRSRAARTPACGEGGQFPPMEQRRLGEVLERLTSFGYACFFQVGWCLHLSPAGIRDTRTWAGPIFSVRTSRGWCDCSDASSQARQC